MSFNVSHISSYLNSCNPEKNFITQAKLCVSIYLLTSKSLYIIKGFVNTTHPCFSSSIAWFIQVLPTLQDKENNSKHFWGVRRLFDTLLSGW